MRPRAPRSSRPSSPSPVWRTPRDNPCTSPRLRHPPPRSGRYRDAPSDILLWRIACTSPSSPPSSFRSLSGCSFRYPSLADRLHLAFVTPLLVQVAIGMLLQISFFGGSLAPRHYQ